MSVHGAVLARLGAVTALTDLVGTRIYNLKAFQDDPLPYVVFTRVEEERTQPWGAAGGVRMSTFQFDSFAAGGESARAVDEQVEVALNRWSGTADGTTVDTILNGDVVFDDYEDETKTYRVSREMVVMHRG